jgi:hypothetical protein
MAENRKEKKISIWVIVAAVVIAASLLVIFSLAVWFFYPGLSPQQLPTVEMRIIPAPTLTPVIPGVQLTQTSGANNSSSNGVMVGEYVQISGTEGEGLRLREGAGMSYPVKFIGMDAEVFLVKDGPKDQDGFTWFLLTAPYDQNRTGWAASKFLTVVANKP